MSNFIATLPDCAPIMSNADKKIVGWESCSDGCKNCPKCTPDPSTPCGQMMLAAGYDCAPSSCHSMCCKSATVSSDNDVKPITTERQQNWLSNNKNLIILSLSMILLAILILFLFKN